MSSAKYLPAIPITTRSTSMLTMSNPPPEESAFYPSTLNPPLDHHQQLQLQVCSRRAKMNVKADKLSSYLRGKHMDIQERVFEYFSSRPDLQAMIEILKDDYRELYMRQLVGLVGEAAIRPFRYVVEDPSKYFATIESIGSVYMSLGIKLGVQYT